MIELLILYSLKGRERTLYSLRIDIIEKFGYFTKPSIGTLHPALKRLQISGAVTVRNQYSEGGKKSTYYAFGANAMKQFKEAFNSQFSENPTLFFTEIQTKISVLSLVDAEEKIVFLKDLNMKLESCLLDLKNTLEDEYVKQDNYQKALLVKNISDIERYKNFVESLK